MAKKDWYLILDFDSTLVKVEAWDELAKLNGRASRMVALTNQAMRGEVAFELALERRLKLLRPNRQQVEALVGVLQRHITESVVRQRRWLKQNAARIWVVSGGFEEFIGPVVAELGLLREQVLANHFVYDATGKVIGFERNNPLIKTAGKAQVIKRLNLAGKILMVGDGISDYLVKKLGAASQFWLFTENVTREGLVDKADKVVRSFEEVAEELVANFEGTTLLGVDR